MGRCSAHNIGGVLAILAALGTSCASGVSGVADGLAETATGQCQGPQEVVLVDRSPTTDTPEIETEQRDIVAASIERAVAGCSELTVAEFGGSTALLNVILSVDATPDGRNSDNRAEESPEKMRSILREVDSKRSDSPMDGGSGQLGAIQWACEQMPDGGSLVVATDGAMTAPVNLSNPELSVELATEAANAVAASAPQSCKEVALSVIGIGRVAGERPPEQVVTALRQFWTRWCSAAAFESCRVTEVAPETVDAANRILEWTDSES